MTKEQIALPVQQEAQSRSNVQPLAYAVYHHMGGGKSLHWPAQHSPNGDAAEYRLVPLYPACHWVGLTDQEFQWIYDNGRTPVGMIEMAEAKLKEKNGY